MPILPPIRRALACAAACAIACAIACAAVPLAAAAAARYVAHTRWVLRGGERLRAEFEPPGVVWDVDGDGAAEVVHWRTIEGREWLVVADGRTGAVRHRAPWPARETAHVYNNFRVAVARLRPGRPRDLVVLSDAGDTIVVAAYDDRLTERWRRTEVRKKDHLGHYVYPVDLTGDGVDEVVVGPMALDAAGRVLWERFDFFYDDHDHPDSYRFVDLDGDGGRRSCRRRARRACSRSARARGACAGSTPASTRSRSRSAASSTACRGRRSSSARAATATGQRASRISRRRSCDSTRAACGARGGRRRRSTGTPCSSPATGAAGAGRSCSGTSSG